MSDIKGTMGLDTSGVKTSLNSVVGDVQSVAGKLAGAFGVGIGLGMIKSLVDTTAELGHMSEEAGLTIRQVQVLRNISGVEFEKVQGSVRKVVDALGSAKEGVGAAKEKFEKLGITFADVQRMSVEDALKAVGNAAETAAPGTAKFSALLDIIGVKSGPEAREALIQFSKVLGDVKAEDATGAIISDKDVENAQKIQKSLKDVGITLQADAWKFFDLVQKGFELAAEATVPGGMAAHGITDRKPKNKNGGASGGWVETGDLKTVSNEEQAKLDAGKKTVETSLEKLKLALEESAVANGRISLEDRLNERRQEQLDLQKEMAALSGKTDYESLKRAQELAVKQDEIIIAKIKLSDEIRKRDEQSYKMYNEAHNAEIEGNIDLIAQANHIVWLANKQKDALTKYADVSQRDIEAQFRAGKITGVEAERAMAASGSISVSPLGVDQMARIGGTIGGAVNPALTAAMRTAIASEKILAIDIETKAALEKLIGPEWQ